jgi:hypothetical protein
MVTVEVPSVAVLLAVNVTTLEPVVGLVENVAVTPLGRPDAARVTLPVNPPTAVTVTVDVFVAPWLTVREAGAAPRVKVLGVTVTVVICVIAAPVAGVTVRV